ncbi:putative aig2 family protein [Daldinia childiae]|uniref:putative aig2 family protein n=1 Tax=Daldinia childiae TaxID=326645 RepID=UPI0014468833|nr:putative aig2 family protein [Daldinia childiae]KAF3057118.1 putative aig2 family protein [Daldinia childiae]
MESTNKDERDGVLYFAYGSNLSSVQMRKRCPKSKPIGLAYLSGWRWIINERGYANIVEDRSKTGGIYGIIYRLHPDDEECLDINEGVPWAYERRFIEVEGLTTTSTAEDKGVEGVESTDQEKKSEKIQALAYIDFHRIRPSRPKNEYIYRMNDGIDEAMMQWGLPEQYVDSVLRPSIPAGGK